jgi:hypothetical protein
MAIWQPRGMIAEPTRCHETLDEFIGPLARDPNVFGQSSLRGPDLGAPEIAFPCPVEFADEPPSKYGAALRGNLGLRRGS